MNILTDYYEIKVHIYNLYDIKPKYTNEWLTTFCPYCDDKIRKLNPSHGHFNINISNPSYCHCWRCSTKKTLYDFLVDTNFKNDVILDKLSKISSNIKYIQFKKPIFFNNKNIYNIITKEHIEFESNYQDNYNKFKQYIYYRCLNIDPIVYLMSPYIKFNKLCVKFYNYNCDELTLRFIDSNKYRFLNINDRYLYFFQDFNEIAYYKNIVISEGIFDIINLSTKYFKNDTDYFYIALLGNNYKQTVDNIITNNLIIGYYNIHIVFDKDFLHIDKLINNIKKYSSIYNTNIKFYFYIPTKTKDISELMEIWII